MGEWDITFYDSLCQSINYYRATQSRGGVSGFYFLKPHPILFLLVRLPGAPIGVERIVLTDDRPALGADKNPGC